jgi:hypothetical protein
MLNRSIRRLEAVGGWSRLWIETERCIFPTETKSAKPPFQKRRLGAFCFGRENAAFRFNPQPTPSASSFHPADRAV